jgi:MFS family permease
LEAEKMEEEQKKVSYIDVLRNKNFFFIWIGKNISYFGTGITYIALIWLVFSLTGSALDVGILMIVQTIPTIALGIFSGAIVDKTNKKVIIILCDIGRGVLVFLLPFVPTVYYIYGIAFFISILRQFSTTSRMALVPSVVKEKELIVANSLYEFTSMVANIAGPAIGGIIVGFMGTKSAFFIDGITYFISGMCIIGLSYPHIARAVETQKTLIVDIKEGLSFVWKTSVIRYLLVLIALLMFSFGFINVLIIVYVKEILRVGAEQFGLLASAQSMGSLIAAFALGALAQRITRENILFIAILILAGVILALGLFASLGIAVMLMFLGGMGTILLSITSITTIQQITPGTMRGRVMGALMTITNASTILSMGIAGYLGDLMGVQIIFIIIGTLLFFFGALTRFFHYEELGTDTPSVKRVNQSSEGSP